MLRSSTGLWAKAFLDVAIAGTPKGRIIVDLFEKKAPLATENFRKLCTGEQVLPRGRTTEELGTPSFEDQLKAQLHYPGSTVHRVHKGYLVQGGDLVSSQGVDQISVFGPTFDAPEETEASVFDQRGLVGTAVSAPHLNGSQFFILTANAARHLDGTCICFGKVTQGMDVVEEIEAIEVGTLGAPQQLVQIIGSGVL